MILNETNTINAFPPTLNGLVLAGGKSRRMGFDKSAIKWHTKEQRYHIADMLAPVCNEVFISCRPEQQSEIDNHYPALADTYTGIGPYGAILSAFKKYPEHAWLVIACDLPLLDTDTLQYLLKNRNTHCIATTFQSPFDGLPEPLVTIWEPQKLPVLLAFLSAGYTCPRKVLIKNETEVNLIKAPDPDALLNANTPGEANRAKEIMDRKMTITYGK